MAAGAIAGLAVVIGAIASALINNAQQKKASEEQQRNQERLSRQNQDIAMENWENTNAEAQRKQYEKAGLSVGMMYSKGGSQGLGATAQGQTSKRDVSEIDLGGAAGMGLTTALQTKMQQAQIENITANTAKTKVETAKTAGVDTEQTKTSIEQTQGNIAKIAEETKNEKIKGAILQIDQEMQAIQKNIASETMDELIRQAESAATKGAAEARRQSIAAGTEQQTQNEQITQIRQATTEQTLRIATQKKGIQITDAQIQKIANEINMAKQTNMQNWDKMSQQDRDRIYKKIEDEGGVPGIGEIIKMMLK